LFSWAVAWRPWTHLYRVDLALTLNRARQGADKAIHVTTSQPTGCRRPVPHVPSGV